MWSSPGFRSRSSTVNFIHAAIRPYHLCYHDYTNDSQFYIFLFIWKLEPIFIWLVYCIMLYFLKSFGQNIRVTNRFYNMLSCSTILFASSGKTLVDLWLPWLYVCVSPEIHRELLHRPVSGYVPEEIWKKAGESAIIMHTHTLSLSFSLSLCSFFA